MYNTAVRMMANEEEAEDVLQESFLSAFRNISSYREDASFGSWLKRIVINKSITLLNKRKLMEEVNEQTVGEYHYEWDVNDGGSTLSTDEIRQAVKLLPDGFRSVLTLYLFEGYDHGEIAGIMNISESTSKSQYNRAKKRLREILKKSVNYG